MLGRKDLCKQRPSPSPHDSIVRNFTARRAIMRAIQLCNSTVHVVVCTSAQATVLTLLHRTAARTVACACCWHAASHVLTK